MNGGFVMIPEWLRLRKPSGNAVLIYVTLGSFGTFNPASGTYDECRPSMARMVKESGLAESTVRRALDELDELEALVRTYRNGRPTVYRLIFGSVTPPTHERGSTGDTPSPSTDDTQGVPPVEPNQEPTTYNQNTKIPPGDADASTKEETSPEGMNAGQIVAGWIDWLRTQQIDLPQQVIGRYAAEIKRQLDQGFGDLLIRKSLHQMFKKGVHGRPALLSSFMVEAQGFTPVRDAGPRSFADQAKDKKERQRIVAQIADRLAESRGWDNGKISANWDSLMRDAEVIFDEEMAKRRSDLYTGGETWTKRPALEVAT